MNKAYYSQLQSIIEKGIKDNPLPIKKGNSIRIGKMAIRHSRAGYLLFDVEQQVQVDKMLSLRGAIAATKLYMANKDYHNVKFLDKKYSKYYNDCMFYQETCDKTTDRFKKSTAEIRLEIAEQEMDEVARSLESIIFNNKR